MKTEEVKKLLQKYFNGESSREEEKYLKEYFQGEEVSNELKEYSEFFGGINELSANAGDSTIETDVMDYILENEQQEKTRYFKLWKTVTGIAASVIIVLGSLLIYEQQQKTLKDTFNNPDQAYAYAEKTLEYVSGKYQKGFAELSNFGKLADATQPLQEGIKPVNEFFKRVEDFEKSND